MVSELETIPSCLLMTSSSPTKEEILARLAELEQELKDRQEDHEKLREEHEALRKENEELREENQQLRKENKRLRAKIRWYEGPHTPPSKEQSGGEESSSSDGNKHDEQSRTDGGTPGRKAGREPEWCDAPDPDRKIASCPLCLKNPVVDTH